MSAQRGEETSQQDRRKLCRQCCFDDGKNVCTQLPLTGEIHVLTAKSLVLSWGWDILLRSDNACLSVWGLAAVFGSSVWTLLWDRQTAVVSGEAFISAVFLLDATCLQRVVRPWPPIMDWIIEAQQRGKVEKVGQRWTFSQSVSDSANFMTPGKKPNQKKIKANGCFSYIRCYSMVSLAAFPLPL